MKNVSEIFGFNSGFTEKNKYRKKPHLINLFFVGYFFGIGFYLTGTYWISNSLQFDQSLKNLIPLTTILIPLLLGLSISIIIFYLNPLLSGVSRDNNYTPPYIEEGKIISGNVSEN